MKYVTKVFSSLTVFFLCVYLLVSIISLQVIARQGMEQEQEQAIAKQKNASILIASKLNKERVSEEEIKTLAALVERTLASEFVILNQESKEIFLSQASLKNQTPQFSLKGMEPNTIIVSKITPFNKKNVLFTRSRIGKTEYFLISLHYLENYTKNLQRTTVYFRIILLLILVIMLPVSWLLTRMITKPIHQLINVATDVSNGNTDRRFTVGKRGDEVEILAESLNKMSDKLTRDIEEIAYEKDTQEFFVSSLSHEIRTPLTSIIGYAQLLQWEELNKESLEFVKYILSESYRLKELSEDVLKLVQLDKQELHLEQAATTDLASYIQEFLLGMNQEGTFEILFEPAEIRLDVNLFKLVISNLLSNALAAMEQPKSLRVYGTIHGEYYQFSFEDDGQGIALEYIDKVTMPFFTKDHSRSSGHLGLGLSLVQTIVSLHNGRFSIHSTEGVGTTVNVELPLKGVSQ